MKSIKIFIIEDEWMWAEAISSVINKSKDTEVIGEAGAAGYLLKNEINEPDTLIHAIHSVHSGEAFITPKIAKKVLNILKNRIQDDVCRLTYSQGKRDIAVD